MLKDEPIFEWDALKDLDNRLKHGVSFREARHAFNDPNQIVLRDDSHSLSEFPYYCLGLNKGKIRIFGSGYWRRGRRIYEKEA